MGYKLYEPCSHCGKSNFKLSNFCIYCGQSLRNELSLKEIFSITVVPWRKNCQKQDCRVANPKEAKFCCFCGKEFQMKEVANEN